MAFDYDSILTATDSNVLNRSEFYKQGITQPDHTMPMRARMAKVGGDDFVAGAMVVMFFVLAYILYRSRANLVSWLKDFFATGRRYAGEQSGEKHSEALYTFLLISVSVLSGSFIFVNDWVERWGITMWVNMPYWLFGVGYVVGMVLIYAKAWLYMLINWTFFDAESNKQWLKGYLLITALTAFLFYPIALMDVFCDVAHKLVSISAILVVITYELLLFYKLLTNFKVKKYGYLLNILYFCSVELMPTLVAGYVAGCLSGNVIVKTLFY